MLKPEVDRMRALLVDAITTLCRSGLRYSSELKVEGLIGITLDEADIILVNLNKTYGSPLALVNTFDKQPFGDSSVPSVQEFQSQESFTHETKRKNIPDVVEMTPDDESEGSPAGADRLAPDKDHSSPRKSLSGEPSSKRTKHNDPNSTDIQMKNETSTFQEIHIENAFSVPTDMSAAQAGSDGASRDTLDSPASHTSQSASTSRHLATPTDTMNQSQSSEPSDSKDHHMPSVKIEIDSDSEVEEVKVEPGELRSCTGSSSMHSSLARTSDSFSQNVFPQALSQSFPASSADAHPELYLSQLPPEFSAAAQSSPAIPVNMFSSSQVPALPGPSGLAGPLASAGPYQQADQLSPRLLGQQSSSNGQKVKIYHYQPKVGRTPVISRVMMDGVEGFWCDVCSLFMADKAAMTKHRRDIHPVKSPSYGTLQSCPYCSYCSAWKSNLKRHLTMAHKDVVHPSPLPRAALAPTTDPRAGLAPTTDPRVTLAPTTDPRTMFAPTTDPRYTLAQTTNPRNTLALTTDPNNTQAPITDRKTSPM